MKSLIVCVVVVVCSMCVAGYTCNSYSMGTSALPDITLKKALINPTITACLIPYITEEDFC